MMFVAIVNNNIRCTKTKYCITDMSEIFLSTSWSLPSSTSSSVTHRIYQLQRRVSFVVKTSLDPRHLRLAQQSRHCNIGPPWAMPIYMAMP